MKFVNKENPEDLLRNKKAIISDKGLSHLRINGKAFVSVSLCP